ncbi:hypothetical protein LCGC14_1008260 [marine sediment metagenome]|uniref:Uncharacterized protein n=1 Tax=marine sediment metagenome TaxID=412755 RepID=A0A0F9NMH4_9ZZZZ
MKVLFFSAPRPPSNKTAMHMGGGRPPMGLAYLSAYLKQFGHESKIIDLYHFGGGHVGDLARSKTAICWVQDNSNPVDIFEEIENYNPDYIGMYLGTVSFYEGLKIAKKIRLKYPDLPFMVGGPHATELPESLLGKFDYIVCGEGEKAVLDIIADKSQKGIVVGEMINDLDSLPLPDYSHFVKKSYNWKLEMFEDNIEPVITINSTRGCPFSCMFCGVANTRFRGLSARVLVNYISSLQSQFGAKGIYFREDNFTIKSKRVEDFCNLLLSENMNIKWACESRVKNLSPHLIEKMAKSGCVGLYIGVESGSDRMLEYIKKGETRKDFIEKMPIFHANGIRTYTTWIYGLPSETEKDREMSDRFCEVLNPTEIDKFVYLGQPGSDFYKILDMTREYELKEPNGIFYIRGFIPLAKRIYGNDDPRVEFVEDLYSKYKVKPGPLKPYYINKDMYLNMSTKKIRKQLSEKT